MSDVVKKEDLNELFKLNAIMKNLTIEDKIIENAINNEDDEFEVSEFKIMKWSLAYLD